MIAVGVFAVLSVAIVLTAITVTRSNVVTRSANSEEDETCRPVSAATLIGALGGDGTGDLCRNQKNLLLEVKYEEKQLKCSQPSTQQETKNAPLVRLAKANPNGRYTLLMLDPDAPGHSLDKLRFWLHWALTDISGKGLRNGITEGQQLMKYVGPTPPKGSGTHHYQIIVFESTKQENVRLYLAKEESRAQFSLENFVTKNGLCKIVGLFQFTVPAPN